MITRTNRSKVNPGDLIIGVGLQYLFEQVTGPQQWILMDPDAGSFKSYEPLIRKSRFILFGGMPQYNNFDSWSVWSDIEMWDQFVRPWNLKMMMMAGGAGHYKTDIDIESYAKWCLSSNKTRDTLLKRKPNLVCLTTRDPYAHYLLNQLGMENQLLPCSSLWAVKMLRFEPSDKRPFIFLVPSIVDRKFNGLSYVDFWLSLYRKLKKEVGDVRVVCHELEEYKILEKVIGDADMIFHADYYMLLREYASAGVVVSGRLHGSLPAYSYPGTRVVNISVDTRGSAVTLLPKIVDHKAHNTDVDKIVKSLTLAQPSAAGDLDAFEGDYKSVISSVLHKLG